MPTLPEHASEVGSALVDVAENSFFAFAVPADREGFVALSPQDGAGDEPWLRASVAFVGIFSGEVELVMPARLARQLLSGLMGLDPDEPTEPSQVADATGEFVNQVCGTWLTRAASRTPFDLRAPQVTWLPPSWRPAAWAAEPSADGRYFAVNDLPVGARITLAARP